MSVIRTSWRHSMIVLWLLTFSVLAMGAAPAQAFPDVIHLPNGFQPEGIAVGTGSTFYVGSIPSGAIYRGDLRTGEGAILVQPQAERSAIGLKYDERTGLLFVAGGTTGNAYIYDGQTGANVDTIQLTMDQPVFINDVVVTRDAAYFTNSKQAEFYRVPLANNGEPLGTSQTIPLGGDYQFNSDPNAFNANGIAATPNGKTLIIVNTSEGALYNVNPETGKATRIDLGGASVPNGDGILLHGKTLYVVQNFLNQIAVVELSPDLTAGAILDTITSPDFGIPTTIAHFGNSLYAVNSHFDIPNPPPSTPYEVVRLTR